MNRHEKQELLKKILANRSINCETIPAANKEVSESLYRIEKFPQYLQLHIQREVAERAEIENPFFFVNDSICGAVTQIDGREVVNFSGYNYLGLSGHPKVIQTTAAAASRWGTSAGASRVVGGEKPPHRALERSLADLHGTVDAIVFVSGYMTNVSTIATLVGDGDLVVHDRLAHNSIVQGIQLSGASRRVFPHNDWQALDALLAETRSQFERVLIVSEGLFSMDGDLCPLDRLVEVKHRHKALLMIDEAHSIGAVGATGRGVGEHFSVAPGDVDVWMGTLSKTLAGCGGYVAGSIALVELLKFSASAFVYSVGMPPPMAAAADEALRLMLAEPERVERLRAAAARFLHGARDAGLDTGFSAGINVVPIIIGGSIPAVRLSNNLLKKGISVQPVIYPAVNENGARLRFFMNCDHTPDQIDGAILALTEELRKT